MAVGLICIIQRILPVKEAEHVTEFAIENKDTFIALDLADDEDGFDSKPFSPFFSKAKKQAWDNRTFGEANKPKSCLVGKRCHRLSWCRSNWTWVRIYNEPEMIEYVKAKISP